MTAPKRRPQAAPTEQTDLELAARLKRDHKVVMGEDTCRYCEREYNPRRIECPVLEAAYRLENPPHPPLART